MLILFFSPVVYQLVGDGLNARITLASRITHRILEYLLDIISSIQALTTLVESNINITEVRLKSLLLVIEFLCLIVNLPFYLINLLPNLVLFVVASGARLLAA